MQSTTNLYHLIGLRKTKIVLFQAGSDFWRWCITLWYGLYAVKDKMRMKFECRIFHEIKFWLQHNWICIWMHIARCTMYIVHRIANAILYLIPFSCTEFYLSILVFLISEPCIQRTQDELFFLIFFIFLFGCTICLMLTTTNNLRKMRRKIPTTYNPLKEMERERSSQLTMRRLDDRWFFFSFRNWSYSFRTGVNMEHSSCVNHVDKWTIYRSV